METIPQQINFSVHGSNGGGCGGGGSHVSAAQRLRKSNHQYGKGWNPKGGSNTIRGHRPS